jgi:hypothetical protein
MLAHGRAIYGAQDEEQECPAAAYQSTHRPTTTAEEAEAGWSRCEPEQMRAI